MCTACGVVFGKINLFGGQERREQRGGGGYVGVLNKIIRGYGRGGKYSGRIGDLQ